LAPTNGTTGSQLIFDPLYDYDRLPERLSSTREDHLTKEWAQRTLVSERYLLQTNDIDQAEPLKNFTWLDEMALIAWSTLRIAEMEDLPFALHYWDLRPYNIILNDREEITQVPLSHISLNWKRRGLGNGRVDPAKTIGAVSARTVLPCLLPLGS